MRGFLFVCFFLSGGTALVYEIVFMGGLALGSALFGGLTPRIRSPIQAYGWLELGIGAWAALLPMLFAWSAAWYPDLFRAWDCPSARKRSGYQAALHAKSIGRRAAQAPIPSSSQP